ncbi:penicillin-binding protein 1A [Thiomonas bhubaneswarensis]|uniref:Penicillin-binding protein 1A n=1 Tax=Thiomonas bhubaneswarensis TaxID=339866 RepID=A0A0K6HTW3_9BURK|nr:PBP1A family penicillin-binding protein [Thiomonas bhubaneswarensis]CUA94365.1 penicillin-binding protein, 1A family [Thiomonas bhubaneswarensis]
MTSSSASSSSPAPKPRSPWWLRALIGLLVSLAGLFVAALLVVGLVLAFSWPRLPDISELQDYQPTLPLRVYSADNVLLGEFGEERRVFTPIGQIPDLMKKAVLATEDDRFYEHGGIDWPGVARALVANLERSRSQGASTITMQVARNFYLSREKTFTRKLFEVLLALKIEQQMSKDQILQLYMNQIFLGRKAYGFAAAAQAYFAKPLDQLSLAQMAMLAGLPKAPSAYNPISNPQRARQRQLHVLARMQQLGWISAAQAQQARDEPLALRTNQTDRDIHAGYVNETVRQMVFDRYQDAAYTRGLNVYTTINARDQLAAWRAVQSGVLSYELRQPYRGPDAFIDLPAAVDAIPGAIEQACADRTAADGLLCSVVLSASPSLVKVMTEAGQIVDISGAGLRQVRALGLSDKAQPATKLRAGAVVWLAGDGPGQWVITQLPQVQSAFVSMNPNNGAIVAMVGGLDFSRNKFNHVTQAWRQPGSSFKPFIYSAALEKGITPLTVVNDAPLFFSAAQTGGESWEPKNYDGKYEGPMSLRRAVAQSKNMVAIRVLDDIGPKFAQTWSTRFGFDASRQPPYLTLALGAGTVTPLQMARAYSVFANGGYLIKPYLISKITDAQGQVLFQDKPQQAGDEKLRVISPRNAYVMDSLLQEVTRSGTAARAQATLKRPDLYGKTGTTNDFLDAWFCGFQPSLVGIAWVGYDTPKKLGNKETGGALALPIWIKYMQTALRYVPVSSYAQPPGIVVENGEPVFSNFAAGSGVRSLGMDDPLPAPEVTPEERDSILNLFKSN